MVRRILFTLQHWVRHNPKGREAGTRQSRRLQSEVTPDKILMWPFRPPLNLTAPPMTLIDRVPQVTFKTRVRDESVPGPNPYRWQDLTSDEIFKGQTVVVFSLPGAFTPPVRRTTCRATKSSTTTSADSVLIGSFVCR